MSMILDITRCGDGGFLAQYGRGFTDLSGAHEAWPSYSEDRTAWGTGLQFHNMLIPRACSRQHFPE